MLQAILKQAHAGNYGVTFISLVGNQVASLTVIVRAVITFLTTCCIKFLNRSNLVNC